MKVLRMLNQIAVYWEFDSVTGFNVPSFTSASPVELKCRWEDRQETFLDPEGKERLSQALVYLNQDVTIDGYLFLGRLTGLNSALDPLEPQNGGLRAYRITAQLISPGLHRPANKVRKVWLA